MNQVLFGEISSCVQERIYLNTHLKEEVTDLFRKLPGYPLSPQIEDGEHFANG